MAAGKNFSSDQFWQSANRQLALTEQEEDDRSEVQFLKRFLSTNQSGDCFEVGSFPGNNLRFLGSLGYTLHGIDLTERNAFELPLSLAEKGCKIGQFFSADFFHFTTAKRYDLVCSFGFVEHFENFLEVIDLHAQFVKKGGLLVITAPNFRGLIQYLVHYLFDRSNLRLHNVKSMRPNLWAKHLEANGFEIIFAGYFGGLSFWLGNKGRNRFEKFLLYLLHGTANRIRRYLKADSSVFSYNCGVIVRKR